MPLPNAKPIAVTCGEPAGIAGEITLKAWHSLHRDGTLCFAVVGDAAWLQEQAALLKLPTPVIEIKTLAQAVKAFTSALPVLPLPLPAPVTLGEANARHAAAVVSSIDRALALCQSGEAAGMVTNPIQKRTLYEAGFAHGGHTEYLGARCGMAAPPLMMLTAQDLRVVPLTVHIPLRDVAARLTTGSVIDAARRLHRALQTDFAIADPRLALAALNPHAGEAGHIGHEEIDILEPAVTALQTEGISITPPLPADTLFHADARRQYDAVLCLYHDQALIPLKTLDFWGGVNVTLGLPMVRTSPDHGTGLAIAGQGIARPDSLVNALRLAYSLAKARSRHAG